MLNIGKIILLSDATNNAKFLKKFEHCKQKISKDNIQYRFGDELLTIQTVTLQSSLPPEFTNVDAVIFIAAKNKKDNPKLTDLIEKVPENVIVEQFFAEVDKQGPFLSSLIEDIKRKKGEPTKIKSSGILGFFGMQASKKATDEQEQKKVRRLNF